jgi:hypothetical protein
MTETLTLSSSTTIPTGGRDRRPPTPPNLEDVGRHTADARST